MENIGSNNTEIPEFEQRDYDHFFLKHLQSVQAHDAWYKNQRFIGKGGNGTTFFVTCTSGVNTGVQFALKVFHKISDDRRRKRFLDEIGHYRTLTHPSIIGVHDEGTFVVNQRSYPFAVIDYVPSNLENELGRGGQTQITRLTAIRYMYNIASAVAYLHSLDKPVVHRDIKPANILVNGYMARLGDLGLAKVLMGNTERDGEDVTKYIAMPKFYRTPELVKIAQGENVTLTVASDIYQLGLVLYRCLTGFNPQQPHKTDSCEPIELDVRDIAGCAGEKLDRLIKGMLRDDPAQRFTARDVLRELSVIHEEVCKADCHATGVTR